MQREDPNEAEELKMENLNGVFLVLFYGSLFACLYGCAEEVIIVYRKSKKAKVFLFDASLSFSMYIYFYVYLNGIQTKLFIERDSLSHMKV